jgi:hypothetical protein
MDRRATRWTALGGTVVASAAMAGWFAADPIRSVDGLADGTLAAPQWNACCMVSNELSWAGLGAALLPVLVAAALAQRWARPRSAAVGALAGLVLAVAVEVATTTAGVLPSGNPGRLYALGLGLVWPLGAGAAALAGAWIRRSWGPSRP